MPFDCAPVIDEPKQGATTAVEALGTNIVARSAGAIRPRPILPWYMVILPATASINPRNSRPASPLQGGPERQRWRVILASGKAICVT